ncbi:GWxTD domain-containing protein, partial [candidate division WOR-3 bacterium]|nr:GWxTD domain-containing protein [candidate division WOR-3 bacterium]
EEGGGVTSAYPFEQWRYRWLEGIGTDIIIEFVDPTLSGEFRMTMDPSEKDALMNVSGLGLTDYEALGFADKEDRFDRTDGTRLGTGGMQLPSSMNQFERLRQFALVSKPPPIKFTDLETAVDSTIRYNLLPMETRVDYMRMTSSTIMTNITLQFDRKDLQFEDDSGVSKAIVNIYGRITSMTRRPVNVFEDVVAIDVPTALLAEAASGVSVYQQSVPLPPGNYRLNIVAKDVVSENMTTFELALRVPYYDEDTLGVSSLVLADVIEKVPTRSIGSGQFVIGTSKVRPRLGETFRRDEKMGIYFQIYNFEMDEVTKEPDGTIEYEVVNNTDNKVVISFTEDLSAIERSSASQTVVEKLLPLENLEPGDYTLRVKVVDNVRGETLSPEAVFKVT